MFESNEPSKLQKESQATPRNSRREARAQPPLLRDIAPPAHPLEYRPHGLELGVITEHAVVLSAARRLALLGLRVAGTVRLPRCGSSSDGSLETSSLAIARVAFRRRACATRAVAISRLGKGLVVA